MVIGFRNSRLTATRVAVTVGAVLLVCSLQSAGAQESRPGVFYANDIPRAISSSGGADAEHAYWRSPEPPRLHASAHNDRGSRIDPNKRYELPG